VVSRTPSQAPPTVEAAARAALEERLGRPLSDAEWRLYTARLLNYIKILQSWETK